MCTASWSVGRGGFSLCFNRDERKARREAAPPAVLRHAGTRLLAAIDPDAGGTWLAVNEAGLCVFLLNNYAAQAKAAESPDKPRSRGELPLHLASFLGRDQACRALLETDLGRFRPFLIALADGAAVEAFAWNGRAVHPVDACRALLTTSSYRTGEVQAYREKRYETLLAGRGSLEPQERRQFHLELWHPDGAFNPMMLRSNSRTHSVSTVDIVPGEVRFCYEPVVAETRTLGDPQRITLDCIQ